MNNKIITTAVHTTVMFMQGGFSRLCGRLSTRFVQSVQRVREISGAEGTLTAFFTFNIPGESSLVNLICKSIIREEDINGESE